MVFLLLQICWSKDILRFFILVELLFSCGLMKSNLLLHPSKWLSWLFYCWLWKAPISFESERELLSCEQKDHRSGWIWGCWDGLSSWFIFPRDSNEYWLLLQLAEWWHGRSFHYWRQHIWWCTEWAEVNGWKTVSVLCTSTICVLYHSTFFFPSAFLVAVHSALL